MSLEGQHLGEFEILERLGQGGMGAVYKARQKSLRRMVALKTLQASLAEDTEYIARFEQEAVAAAGLSHPNLVQVYSAGENDGLHWFAMEYIEGESAKVRLTRKGRLDPLEAIAIAIHVASALEYGWRKAALIHRDIKPDNIFLSEDGEVKLGDLGLAKSAGQTQGLTVTGASMGTPHYISPEQVQAMKDVDLRADIYSLGCTLYHLLSGHAPFEGNSAVAVMMQHVIAPVPDLRSVWPECPPELAKVVLKMMLKPPEARPQSYEEVNAELRRVYDLLSGASVPSGVAVTQKPAAIEKKRGVPLAAWVGGVVLLTAIAALVYAAPWKKGGHESPPRVASLTTARLSPSTEPWQDVLHGPKKPDLVQAVERTSEGLRFTDAGWAMLRADEGPQHDGAVRMLATFGGVHLMLRARDNKNGAYQLSTPDEKSVRLSRWDKGAKNAMPLREFPLPKPLQPGQDYELELRVVGRTLTAKLNGEVLGTVMDGTLAEGKWGVMTGEHSTTPTLVKALEVLDLDAAGGASATLTNVTKDAPFVNTLGMKFVPVPILGGPTGGQRVLFSVWDTRVQDYAEFVKETKRDWPKADFEQGPTHPAVDVSWDDAQLFCQWLTSREQAAGRLPTGFSYRLPSDHEWSCAVGLGAREDAAKLPSEKSLKINDTFPWGTEWPPPKGAGNYAGEELQPALAAGKFNQVKGVLAGYNDGFVNTSPVGSFAANRLGLYDMGGNVWQWCEEWYDKDQKERVERGAAWAYLDRYYLLSSNRTHGVPGHRSNYVGFRCVLAPVSSTLPAVTAPIQAESNTPITATTAQPFVNTLGMKFVPVPILGGPTGGQRVLFSVWDARVQDYAEFVKETKRDWPKADFEQGPTHPAVDVSWDDAQLFCQWLTSREQAAGRLPAGFSYRLPSDHEWSCAVGLGAREDAAKLPSEKSQKINDAFPWGTEWPPPKGAGNYAGEELQPALAAGKFSYAKGVIAGYNDGFVNTSPVGSFSANQFGLYDMGDDVWQWCEEWFDKDQKDRVLRGASWSNSDRLNLLSAGRGHYEPGHRDSRDGFRCVVGVSAR